MAKELIYLPGLTPNRLAVWKAITELEKQKPSLMEISEHAGVDRVQTGLSLQWLRSMGMVDWKSTRRSYWVVEPAPKLKTA